MDSHTNTVRDWARDGWRCDICHSWHVDSDEDPVGGCYYCGMVLCTKTDYSCVSCTRDACDNCCQACQEDDCDVITCNRCVASHLATFHSISYLGP